jgi:hypothetical protein
MCLSAIHLAIFLNIVGADQVTSEPGRYVIAAEAGDAHWVAVGERWCTMAPQIDAMARLAPARAALSE